MTQKKIHRLEKKITSFRAFEKPEEIREGAEIVNDKLYLYGTDFMSHVDIKEYFVQFPDIEIKWINDSSCTIRFTSDHEAQQAYNQYSVRPKTIPVDLSKGSVVDPEKKEDALNNNKDDTTNAKQADDDIDANDNQK